MTIGKITKQKRLEKQVRVRKDTYRDLQKAKYFLELRSYDQVIDYLLKLYKSEWADLEWGDSVDDFR